MWMEHALYCLYNKCFILKFLHGCVDIKEFKAKLCAFKKDIDLQAQMSFPCFKAYGCL